MATRPRRCAFGVCLMLLTGLFGACRSDRADPDHRLTVVASTDVYGDIAQTIGGAQVSVTSLIDSPAQDPHSYEASAHDALAVARADVVIENGGGYDDFMTALRASAGRSDADVIDVVQSSPKPLPNQNEHVWYDLHTVRVFVTRLSATLVAKNPRHARAFRRAAGAFTAGLTQLERTQARLARRFGGTGVAVTEPVPLYLLAACGLVDKTPPEFSRAVEGGTGVPVSVLQQTLNLFSTHTVRLLVYNEQTSGPETEKLQAAARSHGVPVVGVTETLPRGMTYLHWMAANLAAVGAALARAARS